LKQKKYEKKIKQTRKENTTSTYNNRATTQIELDRIAVPEIRSEIDRVITGHEFHSKFKGILLLMKPPTCHEISLEIKGILLLMNPPADHESSLEIRGITCVGSWCVVACLRLQI
jgi:hypothetical protein